MNKIYKTVWSAKKGTYVAVSEIVTNRGKEAGGSEGESTSKPSSRLKTLASILLSIGFVSGFATQAVAQDVTPGNIGSVLGTTYDSDTELFVIPSNGIGGTGKDTVFGAIGKVQGDLTSLTDRVATTESDITALTSTVGNESSGLVADVADNKNAITGLTNKVGAAEKNIGDLQTNLAAANTAHGDLLTALGTTAVAADYKGIKYFRVKSDKADAEAIGEDAVAIGPLAEAKLETSVAIGHKASADGKASIALGDGANVISSNPDNPTIAAISIGKEATVSASNAIAIGNKAFAVASQGIALGGGAQANAGQNISIGHNAGLGTGEGDPLDQRQNTAIGAEAGQNVVGYGNVALGVEAGNRVKGNSNIALGTKAGQGVLDDDNISIGREANNLSLNGQYAIAIGAKSNAIDTQTIALGNSSTASGQRSIAIGSESSATDGQSVALGYQAVAANGNIALGRQSVATQDDAVKPSYLTNQISRGGVVSVGNANRDGSGQVITRRIVNVADGAEDTDAVTVAQLKKVATGLVADYGQLAAAIETDFMEELNKSRTHYFSVNDGGVQKGNWDNATAQGVDSIAIGPGTSTEAIKSTVVGNSAVAEAKAAHAVVLGSDISSDGKNSVTIGNTASRTYDESGIAIGTHVTSRDENSIVIGRDSETDYQGVDGPTVKNSIVVGTKSSSTAEEGIVLGKQSHVTGVRGIAQGSGALTQGEDGTAIGTQSRAIATRGQAFGREAKVYADSGIAFGYGATSGLLTENGQQHSIAIGTGASATYDSSVATGRLSQATANFALASGYKSIASDENAVALGAGAKAQQAGNVALGADSITENVHTGKYYINDATSGFTVAGKTGTGTRTVSVGTAGDERQIQHVAPGVVDANSTDAINGSQLHATNTFANNLGDTTAEIFGGGTIKNPDGTLSDTSYEFDFDLDSNGKQITYNNVGDAMQGLQDLGLNFVGDDNTNVHRRLGEQLSITGGAEGSLTTGNIGVIEDDDGLLIQLAENIDLGNAGSVKIGDTFINNDGLTINDGPSITNVGIDANNTVIKNVAPGVDGTDGVNVDQLEEVKGIANSGWNYTVNDGTSTKVAPGGNVDFANNDGNINIAASADGIDFDLSNQISLGKAGDEGRLTVSDGTYKTIINPTDITVAGTKPVNINGASGTITGLTNTTWDPTATYTGGQAATQEQLSQVSSHLTSKGLNFVGNDENSIHKDLGATLGIVGSLDMSKEASSENIRTIQNADGELEIQLAKAITGLYSIELGADGTKSITLGGNDDGSLVLNPGGDPAKITNVAPGELSENSTDAVNGSQLYATNKKIVNIIGDGADIDGDGNIIMPDFPLYNYKGDLVTSDTVYDALKVAQNHYYSVNADPDLANYNNDGAKGINALAAGVNALAQGDSSVAIGDGARALGDKSISIGQGNIVAGSRSTAIGDPNIIIGSDSHAVGNDNYIGVFADNSLAFGNQNTVTSDSTVSVGNNSTIGLSILSNANNAISVGHDNSIGTGAFSTATNAISLGNNNKIATGLLNNGNNAISVGNDNTIRSEDAIALGNNITIGTGLAGSVGIGANSTVAAANPESDITIGNFTHYFAGDDPQSVVSFGSAGNERQLTNVAAGRISATSTDAINGSQLFAVSDVLGNTVDFIGLEGFADGTYGITFDGNTYTSLGDVLNSLHWNIDVGDGSGPGGSGGSSSGGSGSGGDKTGIHHGDTLTLVAGDNIVIEKTPDGGSGDTDITIGLAPDITVDNVVINEDLTVIGKTDLAGGTLIVEDNSITVGSDTLIDMGDNRVTNVADGVDRGDAVNKGQLDDTRDELIAKGLNFVGDDGQTVHRDLGQTLSITGGATGNLTSGNIGVVEDSAGGLSVQLAENIDLGSNGSVTMGDTTVNNSGIAIYNSSTDNTVSLSKHGLDNGGNRITNVAPGIAGTDAVNVDQLSAVNNNLQQQIDGNRYDIKRNNNRANAGIAAAMATAGLPQAYLPGKSMVAIAGGVWRGESGMAIGVSTVSENGKWILKGSANTSGRGGAGGTIGAGYQW